jgi:hypothetical protein
MHGYHMPLKMSLKKVTLIAVFALKVFLTSMNIQMSFEEFPDKKFLPTSLDVACKSRLKVIIKMRFKIVEAREKFAAVLADVV